MLRLSQIKILVNEDTKENLELSIRKRLNVKQDDVIEYKIYKKSIDARRKDKVYYIYEINVSLKNENVIKRTNDVFDTEEEVYNPVINKKKVERPIIIGFGPAGMFAAYEFAKYGYKPIVYERGCDVETRIKKVEEFWKTGKLDTECNVQFGEGGAGTFSDGKLNTMIKDKEHRKQEVLKIFVENGANESIMYVNKPHLGTDWLRTIVKNMREKIISWGGEVHFNSKLTDIKIENNELQGITINDSEYIKTNCLILAIGHSARETFYMLNEHNLSMNSKPFAVGLRVEHKQSLIDENQYGKYAKYLPPADYKLTYTAKSGRGVYSFCMCPGGYVVNSSSVDGQTVVNGMSNKTRESDNANSAIIVTVSNKEYGDGLFDGIKFQEKLEKLCYKEGNGAIPLQKNIDFKNNVKSTEIGSIKPIVKGNFAFGNLRNILPEYLCNDIIEAFKNFDNKIKGFDDDDALLLGVESRTSSPVRINRDDNLESNIKGIYPCGEGAGYAGGITSSAIDGLKVFESIIK